MSSIVATDREFGELSERVLNLGKRVEEVRSEVRAIDEKVDGIISRFDKIDGAMKLAMGVSGFIGAAAMLFLTKVIPLLFAGLPRI